MLCLNYPGHEILAVLVLQQRNTLEVIVGHIYKDCFMQPTVGWGALLKVYNYNIYLSVYCTYSVNAAKIFELRGLTNNISNTQIHFKDNEKEFL